MIFPPDQRITLELCTSRTNEHTAEAMAQIYATLPGPPHELHLFWKQSDTVIFEFLSQNQHIQTYVTCTPQLEQYLITQIIAAYPDVLLKRSVHHKNETIESPSASAVGKLVLTAPSIYPFLTYKETGNIDPLSSVLSVLSILQKRESAIVQLVMRKARDGWKRAGYDAKTPNISEQAHLNQSEVEKKIAQLGFQMELRVLAQASTNQRAQEILRAIAQAYGGYRSVTNGLRLENTRIFQNALEQNIFTQSPEFSIINPQYVSLDELATLFHLPNKQLSSIKNIAWGKSLLGEPPENLPTFSHFPKERQNGINLFARTVHKNTEQIFGIKREDRRRHMYVLGKSGSGKSTLLANMIINDLKHNEGLAVIDPHGDLIETVLNYIPKNRMNDVIVFDPADPHAVVKLNLFDGGTIVHRELIASGIVAVFQKLFSYSWGPRLEYILRNTLLTLLDRHSKLSDVIMLLTNKEYRDHVVATLEDPILKNFWISEFNAMPERLRQEAISPILNKVGQFVTSPLVRNVVNNTTSSFSIEDVMNQGKILLVNVSQGKLGENNAALLGAMIITQIQLTAMNRVYQDENKRKDFFLYIDEFQNFATTSFITVLSEARKYRLNLILSNQYIAQIPEEISAAIFGNTGTIASFLVGADDAGHIQKEFENIYTADDLVSLTKYQIILKLLIDGQGSRPFSAYTLPLASSNNSRKVMVLRNSRERYARTNHA